MTFNEKLRKYRKQAKITQQALATLVGVSHSSINRWEKGTTTPPFSTVEKIANALHISPSQIIGNPLISQTTSRCNLPYIPPILSDDIIAFQGFLGAYSHVSCVNIYGKDVQVYPCKTFKHAFEAVENHQATVAVIPIENSLGGRVADIHHLLPESHLHIVGEYYLSIRHCLLGIPGARIADIKTVYSHEQGIAQCRHRLHNMNLETQPHIDTAGAAAFVADKKDIKKAAIASELAGKIYNLSILEHNMQDTNTNITRFIILRQKPLAEETFQGQHNIYKTSCLFYTRNIPAALYKALGGFATNAINFSKLESYVPLLNTQGNAFFYIEFDGHTQDQRVSQSLDELNFYSNHVRILGSYKKNPFR